MTDEPEVTTSETPAADEPVTETPSTDAPTAAEPETAEEPTAAPPPTEPPVVEPETPAYEPNTQVEDAPDVTSEVTQPAPMPVEAKTLSEIEVGRLKVQEHEGRAALRDGKEASDETEEDRVASATQANSEL